LNDPGPKGTRNKDVQKKKGAQQEKSGGGEGNKLSNCVTRRGGKEQGSIITGIEKKTERKRTGAKDGFQAGSSLIKTEEKETSKKKPKEKKE